MSEAVWIATTLRLPADGQDVLVKTAHGTVEHRVRFRAEPERRWETTYLISDLDMYAYWRPLQAERRRPTGEAHASP
jgi:hypothetical protein